MKYGTKFILASAVAICTVAGSATAADLPPLAPPPPPPVEAPVEFGSGWYLRGDLSYAVYDNPVAYQSSPVIHLLGESMDNGVVLGIGAGYKFNSWFRSDLTLEYRFDSTMNMQSACGGCVPVGNTSHAADFKSWVFMANAYADLGTWNSITPYIGAGIGWGRHTTTNFRNVGTVVAPSGVTNIAGASTWEFVWAVMAGASIDLSANTALDVGYRYIDLGSAISGTATNLGTQAPAIVYDDLAAHEFRVGLRYMFDSSYDYAPIVTKY